MTSCGGPNKPLRIGEVDFDARPDTLPGLVLTGNPMQRGETYGRVFADKIRANICRHLDHPDLPPYYASFELLRKVYIPAFVHYWPRGWNELLGMAKGCGMEVEHLVYLNVRDDLAAIRHHLDPSNNDVQHAIIPLSPQHATESTSAFFSHHKTKDRVPILAHSWSESKRIHDDDEFMVLLEIQYCCHEDVADMVILVEAGMISGSGMNSLGLAVTGNPLFSNVDHIPGFGGNARYFPMTCLERYLLEWANVDIEYVCTDLDRHASKHVLLADRNGNSVSLELGPGKHTFVHDGKFGSLARFHTNHFHSWPYWRKCNSIMCRYRGDASPFRLRRLGEFLERAEDERLTALEIKAMFSDHERGGSAMCQHGHGDGNKPDCRKTVALVMYDTHRKVVSVCKGPPCKGTVMHFAVRQSKPLPDLPVPGAARPASPIVPLINADPAVDTAVAALRDMEVQLEMARPRDAAGNRQICNTPESDRESKRRRLNNSPVSDLAQDEI